MWLVVLTLLLLFALPPLVLLYLVERFRLARALGRRGSRLLAATPHVYFFLSSRRLQWWRLLVGRLWFDVRYRGADGVERVDRFWPVGPVGPGGREVEPRRAELGPRYLNPQLSRPR